MRRVRKVSEKIQQFVVGNIRNFSKKGRMFFIFQTFLILTIQLVCQCLGYERVPGTHRNAGTEFVSGRKGPSCVDSIEISVYRRNKNVHTVMSLSP